MNGVNGLPPSRPVIQNAYSETVFRPSHRPMAPTSNHPKQALDDMLMSPRNGYNPVNPVNAQIMENALNSFKASHVRQQQWMTRPNVPNLGSIPNIGSIPNMINITQSLSGGNAQCQPRGPPQVVAPPQRQRQGTQFPFAQLSVGSDGSIPGAPAIACAPPPLHFQLSADVLSPTSAMKQ